MLFPSPEWETGALEEAGIDAAAIEHAARAIAADHPHITSVLVVRNGAPAWERYFGACEANVRHYTASVTKSFLSIVFGMTLDAGLVESIDQPVSDFFPEYEDLLANKRDLRIRHLLSMTTGLTLAEPADWTDPVREALRLERRGEPGRRFYYGDPPARILSGIISRAAGKNAYEFAKSRLFDGLGFASTEWPSDPQGHSHGPAGILSTSRDMARLGLLALCRGRWKDQQVVSSEWIDACTRTQNLGGPPVGHPYGYLWWTHTFQPDAFAAVGAGGQLIAVFPSLAAVIVATAEVVAGQSSFGAIRHLILPAIL